MTTSTPVRITNAGEKYVSTPVCIVNIEEIIDWIQANGLTIVTDTSGTHVEVPPRWDDLRFPAQGINPSGSPAPPSVDNDLSLFPGSLIFAGNQENNIGGIAQLPHAWVEGSEVHPHIHWHKTANDASNLAVGWQFQYRISNPGGTWTAWSGWQNHTLAIGSNTLTNTHALSEFPVIDMTGYTVSAIIAWQVRRTGDTDAYNGTTRLFELDFHHQVDTLGSTSEYIK